MDKNSHYSIKSPDNTNLQEMKNDLIKIRRVHGKNESSIKKPIR